MTRLPFALLAFAAVACQPGQEASAPDPVAAEEAAQPDESADSASEMPEPPADTAPSASVSSEEPEQVLADWAAAIEARDWDTARAVWGESGEASGLSPSQFARAYEKYATIDVEIGEAVVEGAAGSLYYEPVVTMSGELQSGEPYLMEGPVRLRRVNDVPGATPEQLRWHIEDSGLRPKPVEE